MKRRFLAQTSNTLPRIAQELMTLAIDSPHEVIIRPFDKRLSDPQRAVLHSMLRDISRAFGCSEAAVKVLCKRGEVEGVEWPGEFLQGLKGTVWVPRDTMDLTTKQTNDLIDQLGAFGSDNGVEWARVETWSDDT